MASSVLTSSTSALLLSLLLFTNLLGSASAYCRFEKCVVSSLCKATTDEGSTTVDQVCCTLLEPLSSSEAVQCICKGNQGANLQNVYGILGSSCDRPVPRVLINCQFFKSFSDRNVLSLSN
uniref:Bg70 protein n=1 Tax=Rhizophora mucronata TaxID=61149 RepID=A0A2P2L5H0_RHIMU